VSHDRGLRLQNALARYLVAWWPGAESAGPGRPGTDVTHTRWVKWENKTADKFAPLAWVRQARGHVRDPGDIALTVYLPRGVGEASVGDTLTIMRTIDVMMLLEQAGYTDLCPLTLNKESARCT
jgi:hypothetical protein